MTGISKLSHHASWHPLALSRKLWMSRFMTLSFQNHKGRYRACENVILNRKPADRKHSLATDRHWWKAASHEMSHACMNKQNTQANTHTHAHTLKLPWVQAPPPSNVDLNLARHDKSFVLSFHTNSFLATEYFFSFIFLHPNDYRGIIYHLKAWTRHAELLFVLNENISADHGHMLWFGPLKRFCVLLALVACSLKLTVIY